MVAMVKCGFLEDEKAKKDQHRCPPIFFRTKYMRTLEMIVSANYYNKIRKPND
jgi:hypothetical protein